MFDNDWNRDQWGQSETPAEPEPTPTPEPEPARAKTKPKAKSKSRTKTSVALIREVLDAQGRLDRVRGPLRALTGRNDEADLIAALLDGRAAAPATLLMQAVDEPGEAPRAIMLVKAGQKEQSALRDAARLACALNPDLKDRLNTTNAMDLALVLSETVPLLDRTMLEALAR